MFLNSYLLEQMAVEYRRQAERDAAMDALVRQTRVAKNGNGAADLEVSRLTSTVTSLACPLVCCPAQG